MKALEQEYRNLPVGDLKPHPRNPRRGNVDAIEESIDANGFYGAIIVQKSTGYVLAGNHRLQAAVRAGAEQVPVLELDVDDETATRILLADNRTNDKAGYDDEVLAGILAELAHSEAGLEALAGTGYTGDDLDELTALVNPDEWTPGNVDLGVRDFTRPEHRLVLGRYKFDLPPAELAAWVEAILAECGGDPAFVPAEIARRLDISLMGMDGLAKIQVGPYEGRAFAQVFEKWLNGLRLGAGFTNEQVLEEAKRRLGIGTSGSTGA